MSPAFRCGHPRTPENSRVRRNDGYAYCAFCDRVRQIRQGVDRFIAKQNKPLTLGQKIARGQA